MYFFLHKRNCYYVGRLLSYTMFIRKIYVNWGCDLIKKSQNPAYTRYKLCQIAIHDGLDDAMKLTKK